jgi:hypothetical protein
VKLNARVNQFSELHLVSEEITKKDIAQNWLQS